MSKLINDELRRQVLHEEDGFYPFQGNHIISRKHDGPTILSNLAFACRCATPDAWNKHFRINRPKIEPFTDIAEGTARILAFDHEDRLLDRATLIVAASDIRASPLWRAPEVITWEDFRWQFCQSLTCAPAMNIREGGANTAMTQPGEFLHHGTSNSVFPIHNAK